MEDKNKSLLTLAALGVVYGDIGTSPLYALRECFTGEHPTVVDKGNVFGVLSLIFWSLILIISVKYLLLIMRADNQGEGGILALMQLVLPDKDKPKKRYRRAFVLAIGLFGAALLYGDGILTPAISVLSAVEGLEIVAPNLEVYVVPITLVILIGLFWLQSRGTAKVGRLFGPIMALWFTTLAVLGIVQIVQSPEILAALNPYHGLQYLLTHGKISLYVLGAIFLVVTGGEALYADMGHFGIRPIRIAWFCMVLPGLLINYFGQGALLLRNPAAAKNPFYLMAPEWALIPMIILAMMATIIASQAVISGAFSLTFQAIQLNYLPRLRILHTSETARGQVYLPKINLLLLVATLMVVLTFQSSSNLAVAYGIAITVTMVITDILAFYAMRGIFKWSLLAVLPITLLFLSVDASFLAANALKILEGGWFPLTVAAIIFTFFRMWIKGQKLVRQKLSKFKSTLSIFLKDFERTDYAQVDGTAVYLTADVLETPMAFQHNLKHNKVVHDKVVILAIGIKNTPSVDLEERLVVDSLGNGFYRVLMKYGYMDRIAMSDILELWKKENLLKDHLENLTFFIARQTFIVENDTRFNRFEDAVFVFLRRNSLGATRYFEIPTDDIFEIGIQVKI